MRENRQRGTLDDPKLDRLEREPIAPIALDERRHISVVVEHGVNVAMNREATGCSGRWWRRRRRNFEPLVSNERWHASC